MIIWFHRKFNKAIAKQPRGIQIKFKGKLEIFREDPFHYSLNNHALYGKFLGTHSFDVTGDVRVHYEESNERATLMNIGTHPQLYK